MFDFFAHTRNTFQRRRAGAAISYREYGQHAKRQTAVMNNPVAWGLDSVYSPTPIQIPQGDTTPRSVASGSWLDGLTGRLREDVAAMGMPVEFAGRTLGTTITHGMNLLGGKKDDYEQMLADEIARPYQAEKEMKVGAGAYGAVPNANIGFSDAMKLDAAASEIPLYLAGGGLGFATGMIKSGLGRAALKGAVGMLPFGVVDTMRGGDIKKLPENLISSGAQGVAFGVGGHAIGSLLKRAGKAMRGVGGEIPIGAKKPPAIQGVGKKMTNTPYTEAQFESAKHKLQTELKRYKKEAYPIYKSETEVGREAQIVKAKKAYSDEMARSGDAKKASLAKQAAAKGAFKRSGKGVIKLKLDGATEGALIHKMNVELRTAETLKAESSLRKLIAGEPITESEIKILEKGLGMPLVNLMLKNKSTGGKIWYGIKEAGGFKRALMTAMDVSGTLRQNFTAFTRNPISTTGKSINALRYIGLGKNISAKLGIADGEQAFKGSVAKIKNHIDFDLAKEAGLPLQDIGGNLESKADEFASTLADKVAPIRATERHFIGLGNTIRFPGFYKAVEKYGLSGKKWENLSQQERELLKAEAFRLNNMTGIGSLPARMEKYRTGLNALFFSPRLLASRLHYLNPKTYFSRDIPASVRKQSALDMASMIGFSLSALATAQYMGAKVEWNPLSSDFGKARVGNTRFELLGGFSPYIRFIAQVTLNKKKNTKTGKIESLEGYGKGGRGGTIFNFTRSKLSPLAGDTTNIVLGKDFVGRPTTGRRIVLDSIPLNIQDTWDAMHDEDATVLKSLMAAFASTSGIGLQTYGSAEEKRAKKEENAYLKMIKSNGDLSDDMLYRLLGIKLDK